MRRLPMDRRGTTLAELMIGMVLTLVLTTAALTLITQQMQAVEIGTGRMNVLQNYRFALSELRRDLRTMGTGVATEQPWLVYAGGDAIIFNADYASNQPRDPFSVYSDAELPGSAVRALTRGDRAELVPQSGFVYPDTTYGSFRAETISFYFLPDNTTTRSDDFVLMRRVNTETPEVVSRNLLRTGTQPFFEYLRVIAPPDQPVSLSPVNPGNLPMRHVAVHGRTTGPAAQRDVGAQAVIDSVRAVRVRFTSTNGRSAPRELKRDAMVTIRLPNAGILAVEACGGAPQPVTGVSADTTRIGAERVVVVRFNASVDESAGESDVLRYLIWRRQGANPWPTEPQATVSAGQATYVHTDESATMGMQYQYGVAPQDCTPSTASMVTSGFVTP
jgi:type II secretory pathway pseudopilin PulG